MNAHAFTQGSPSFGDPLIISAHDTSKLELINMYAISIDPKDCSKLISKLNAHPLPESLSHVKRIRKPFPTKRDTKDEEHDNQPPAPEIHVLLCPVDVHDVSDDDNVSVAADNVEDTSYERAMITDCSPNLHQGSISLTDSLPVPLRDVIRGIYRNIWTTAVPRYAPHSHEDKKLWDVHWPVSLRVPQKHVVKERNDHAMVDGKIMREFMKYLYSYAAVHSRMMGYNAEASTPTMSSKRPGACDTKNGLSLLRNACIIADPKTNTVIAHAVDQAQQHPLHHAVMVAIEHAAEWQRRTWYAEDMAGRVDGASSSCATVQKESDPGNEKESSAMPAIFLKKQKRENTPEVISDSSSINTDLSVYSNTEFSQRPYLCTGYDCYVLHEPCSMCAMALVHSRVRRVVFSFPDEHGGVLGGSGFKLHSKRSLNHHYAVYQMPIIHKIMDN